MQPVDLPGRAQGNPRFSIDWNLMTGQRQEIATLGGGCFWCLDAVLRDLRGVRRVVSGYTGGQVADP